MRVMYVSKAFSENIGATMHYNALKEIVGAENVYTLDLRLEVSTVHSEYYIAFGKYKNKLERIHRWLQGNMMFLSNAIIDEALKLIEKERINVVFIEDSVFGNLVKRIKEKYPKVLVISFYHDIKAVLYKQWIQTSSKKNYVDYRIGIVQENVNQQYSDINIVFNRRDADLFFKMYGKMPEAILALPAPIIEIDETIKRKITTRPEKKTLLFVGKKYGPNLSGLEWFVNNVLPCLDKNFNIQIVGRGLETLDSKYDDERLDIVGGVDSLTPYYQEADIVFAPLFEGGGMKSKTVEAISFGKTFVGTSESLFGFWEEMDDTIRNKIVYSVDTPEEWVEILNSLARSEVSKFNSDLYDLFLEKFSYGASRDNLRTIIQEEYV